MKYIIFIGLLALMIATAFAFNSAIKLKTLEPQPQNLTNATEVTAIPLEKLDVTFQYQDKSFDLPKCFWVHYNEEQNIITISSNNKGCYRQLIRGLRWMTQGPIHVQYEAIER